jgi:hypothetical protein
VRLHARCPPRSEKARQTGWVPERDSAGRQSFAAFTPGPAYPWDGYGFYLGNTARLPKPNSTKIDIIIEEFPAGSYGAMRATGSVN